ncbi:MAG: DMP19 family protein [Desulfobacteraceae bacterium]|nr:DMP19 family protein [Desulfobacteraceae bacterium]
MKIIGIIGLIILLIVIVFYTMGSKKNSGNIETAMNESMKYGQTVSEVLSHRGKAEDWELDANIGFILLNKEEKQGLSSFTIPERYIYAIEGMVREVNNGGFNQFFFNSSGELAYDLIPALEAINALNAKEIAQRALKIFGQPASLDRDTRVEHLGQITNNFELELWNECDNAFYDLSEQFESIMLDYIEQNINEFDS